MMFHMKSTTREAAIVEARAMLSGIVQEREYPGGNYIFIGENKVVFVLLNSLPHILCGEQWNATQLRAMMAKTVRVNGIAY